MWDALEPDETEVGKVCPPQSYAGQLGGARPQEQGFAASTSAVSGESKRAAAWCEYLAQHARRVYGLVEAAKVNTARTVGRRIADGKLDDGFTVRDVVRKQWAGVTTNMHAEAALAALEEHGWIIGADTENPTGRPTTRYYINPQTRRAAA